MKVDRVYEVVGTRKERRAQIARLGKHGRKAAVARVWERLFAGTWR